MSIKEKEEVLFEKWGRSTPLLIKDGVADEAAYLKAPVKLLYLLKEVNGGDSGSMLK